MVVVAARGPKPQAAIAPVVRKPRRQVEANAVIAHGAPQVATRQVPDDARFVESSPLTSTGKMDIKTVRAHLDSRGYELPDLRGKAN